MPDLLSFVCEAPGAGNWAGRWSWGCARFPDQKGWRFVMECVINVAITASSLAHCVSQGLDLLIGEDFFEDNLTEAFTAFHDMFVMLFYCRSLSSVAWKEDAVAVLNHNEVEATRKSSEYCAGIQILNTNVQVLTADDGGCV